MASPGWLFRAIALSLYGSSFLWILVQASNTPYLMQSFFFDYNLPSQPVPIPVTPQCQTIHITWGRGIATGPNPTAPYFLQVYTSSFVFPFIIEAGAGLSFDWAVPFAPGTLYQICMFDKNGNTGGCQATYTVIPSASNQTSCTNVTFPLGPLDINAVVANGPLSQYGWVDQCTDISVTPKNGTPPYIFTIAPTLHPPYNITSNDRSSMNWTVSLSWASQFFISVVDASGNSWANGPLHSGENGPTTCLTSTHISSNGLSTGIVVGAGGGGLAVGALVGIVSAYVFMKRRQRKERNHLVDIVSPSPTAAYYDRPTSGSSSQYRVVPSTSFSGQLDTSLGSSNPSSNSSAYNRLTHPPSHYQVEPFVVPFEDGTLHTARSPNSSVITPASPTEPPPAASSSHVYVVHHDGGRAPVTVYHEDGTEVHELPPRYIGSDQSTTESRGKRVKVGGVR